MSKEIKILVYALTILTLIGLVPVIQNDYYLTFIYLMLILLFTFLKKEKADWLFITIGFFSSFLGEYFFITTGVETFSRNSLFGIMPLWLPFLWTFIFLSMKRIFWIIYRDYLSKKNLDA